MIRGPKKKLAPLASNDADQVAQQGGVANGSGKVERREMKEKKNGWSMWMRAVTVK